MQSSFSDKKRTGKGYAYGSSGKHIFCSGRQMVASA